jgi:glycosyltransferase involved in cell wall biosynthesis
VESERFSLRPELSVVIPAHNSAAVLERTVDRLLHRLAADQAEILVVENGSTDDTARIARNLAAAHGNVIALTSPTGMGEALRVGIAASSGRRVLLTADDLPFGFDDLDGARKLPDEPPIVIGSKAHPDSCTPRGVARAVSTWGFRTLRRLVLRSHVGDSQGTILADGEWLRGIVGGLDAAGFLFSTQLCYVAELQGLKIVEVPVRLDESHGDQKASTVRLVDVWRMGVGIVALRRSRERLARLQSTVCTR